MQKADANEVSMLSGRLLLLFISIPIVFGCSSKGGFPHLPGVLVCFKVSQSSQLHVSHFLKCDHTQVWAEKSVALKPALPC